MRFDFQSLLNSLTTVFAWMPSLVLLGMPIVGLYTGLIYVDEIGVLRIAWVSLLVIGGTAGFLGLTAVSWGLKLSLITQLLCLCCGAITLISTIVIGYMSGDPMLKLGLSVIEVYLFISPLFFLILHAFLTAKRLHLQKPYR
jgi:hypothetical protein